MRRASPERSTPPGSDPTRRSRSSCTTATSTWRPSTRMFKTRGVSINVNYRYLDDELWYLLDNSDSEALIFHSSLGDRVARVVDRLPKLKLLVEVDDGEGAGQVPDARRLRGRDRRHRRRWTRIERSRRRHLHALHRRHDRHAQGRDVRHRRHGQRDSSTRIPDARPHGTDRCRRDRRHRSWRRRRRATRRSRSRAHR